MALSVLVDGRPLGDVEARAMWQRFSAWMEEHKGDLAGFAKAEGFASVHPELHGGEPVLIASRAGTQRAYETAPTKRSRPDPGRSGGAKPGARPKRLRTRR
jgi:hypothetical protein